MKCNLYLIPTPLGENDLEEVMSPWVRKIIHSIEVFIVEELKTARRFLKKAGIPKQIDDLTFYVLNEHSSEIEINNYLEAAEKGKHIGLLSEAGMPCIADPGSVIVRMAHQKGLRVIPLTGPSSILLALVASGFNGQHFAFNGYLPIKQPERSRKLKSLETKVQTENQTQLFMEAPYRNMQLLEEVLKTANSGTMLCIACDITLETEFIQSKTIKEWKNNQLPDLNKRPAIFIFGK